MDNIADLLSSISPDDLSKLKSVAQGLMGGGGNSGGSGGESQPEPQKNESGDALSSLFGDDVTSSLVSVMSNMNKEDDRTRFINALKPLLSDDRRKKADEAVKFLRLMEMLPLLKGLF